MVFVIAVRIPGSSTLRWPDPDGTIRPEFVHRSGKHW